MKNNIYAIALLAIILSFGCSFNRSHLSVMINDGYAEYTFEAIYPESKTAKLERYLKHELNNELPLDQHIDLMVGIANGEKFNLKATKGNLKIRFYKRKGSVTGYIKIKNLVEGLREQLTE
jgi:hypothetical protein